MIRTTTTSTSRRTFASLAGLALMIATGCNTPSSGQGTSTGGGTSGVTTKPNTGTSTSSSTGSSTSSSTTAGAVDHSYEAVSAQCAAEKLSASKVYYACDCAAGAAPGCVPGNDSNPGTESAPFQTAAKAIQTFNQLNAGEAVVFCRGGSFDVPANLTIFNTSCKKDSPCTIRDYTPSWAKANTPVPAFNAKGAQNVFEFTEPGLANHDEGYRLHNLKIDASGANMGVVFYNDVDDVDMCNLEVANGNIGVYSSGSNPPDTTNPGDGANDRITLRGSYIHHALDQGFLGSGRTVNIDSNLFDYNGIHSTMFLHSIYIDNTGSNYHVGSNRILHSTHGPGGQCQGNPIVAHGVQDGIVIEDNEVDFEIGEASAGCWGITVDAGYGGEHEEFKNVVIRGNRVTNPGIIGLGVSSCSNCVIEDNLVVQSNTFDTTGVQSPDRDTTAEDATVQNVTVRSNTIIANGGGITGVQLGAQGSGHVIADNAVARTKAGNVNCYAMSTGATSDYNACFAAGGTLTWATPDAHAVTTDPQFTGMANGDYVPGASSPLRDAANPTTASKTDITGEARDAKPDIGAFEAR